jgi:hypothetical protein
MPERRRARNSRTRFSLLGIKPLSRGGSVPELNRAMRQGDQYLQGVGGRHGIAQQMMKTNLDA